MQAFKILVIGAGAAGIVAAIGAKRQNKSVLLCDRMQQPGKKILASGNGRCNLMNDRLAEDCYNPAARNMVRSVFSRFDKIEILSFFRDLGLEVFSEEGRVFPVTNQAASVLKVLELELRRLFVPLEMNFQVARLFESEGSFIAVSRSGHKIAADNVIICTGGRSYPALGSDGSGYELAKTFGHKLIEPVPVAVPLVVKMKLCHFLQGQKIPARAKAVIDNNIAAESRGDLLFTQYGLSGTAILDISRDISVRINRAHGKDACVKADLVPYLEKNDLKERLQKRLEKGVLPQDMLAGILPNKFCQVFSYLFKDNDMEEAANILKDMSFDVAATRGWNEAEFTAGGIDLAEVNADTLESKLKKGLYFAGEILDVDGKRGGYNLAWAWASGLVAGSTLK